MLTGTIAARLPAMWAAAGPFLASIDDTSNTRKLQIIAAGLAALGIFLLLFTVWFWRSSRADHSALGPLEVMGARRWRRAPMNEQINRLAEVRPVGALALAGTDRPAVDLEALVAGHRSSTPDRHGGGFSDLVEGEPQSLVASIDEPWDGDLGVLDAELDAEPSALAAEGPVEAAGVDDEPDVVDADESFEPDHSPRPSPEELQRIEDAEASSAASEPADVGPAVPVDGEVDAADDRGGADDVADSPADLDEGADAAVDLEAGADSPVDPDVDADSPVDPDEAADSPVGATDRADIDEATDSAAHAPDAGVVLGSAEAAAAAGPAVMSDVQEASTGMEEQDESAGPREVADEQLAPPEADESGGLPSEPAGHPRDAGDALAVAFSLSDSDLDEEFDPSKELAFERPQPVAAAPSRGAVTDSFKPPRWRRFRR